MHDDIHCFYYFIFPRCFHFTHAIVYSFTASSPIFLSFAHRRRPVTVFVSCCRTKRNTKKKTGKKARIVRQQTCSALHAGVHANTAPTSHSRSFVSRGQMVLHRSFPPILIIESSFLWRRESYGIIAQGEGDSTFGRHTSPVVPVSQRPERVPGAGPCIPSPATWGLSWRGKEGSERKRKRGREERTVSFGWPCLFSHSLSVTRQLLIPPASVSSLRRTCCIFFFFTQSSCSLSLLLLFSCFALHTVDGSRRLDAGPLALAKQGNKVYTAPRCVEHNPFCIGRGIVS